MNVNYAIQETPKEYKCSKCGKSHIKLWREYQTFSPKLFCAECAAKNQKMTITIMRQDGKYHDTQSKDGMGYTDQIGWLVPAVPDEEGVGFWGYTSVPPAGVKWWQLLPNGR